jgi:hypothetical protein
MKDLFKSNRTPVFSVEKIGFNPNKQLFKSFYSAGYLLKFVLCILKDLKILKNTRFLSELINHTETNFSIFGVVPEKLETGFYLFKKSQNFKTEYV